MARKFKRVKSSTDMKTIVNLCLKDASKKGIKVVGIRGKNKCTTTKGNAKYDRHGPSGDCKIQGSVGVGLGWRANYVYLLKQ